MFTENFTISTMAVLTDSETAIMQRAQGDREAFQITRIEISEDDLNMNFVHFDCFNLAETIEAIFEAIARPTTNTGTTTGTDTNTDNLTNDSIFL